LSEEKRHQPEEIVLNDHEEDADSVRISSDVIGILAGTGASEVKGLAGMSGSIVGGIAEKLGRKDFSRGIKVSLEDSRVTLDLYVIVEYGYRIQEVTEELKKTVRSSVEETTGLKVVSVNIYVQGIHLPDRDETVESS